MMKKYNWQENNSEKELLEKQFNKNNRYNSGKKISKKIYVLGIVLPLIIAFFMSIGTYYFTMRTVSIKLELFDVEGNAVLLNGEEWTIDSIKIVKVGDNSAMIKSRVKSEKSFSWEIEGYEEKEINIKFDRSKTMRVELKRIIYKPIIVKDEKGTLLDSVQISGVEYEYRNSALHLKAPQGNLLNVNIMKEGYETITKRVDFINEDTIYVDMIEIVMIALIMKNKNGEILRDVTLSENCLKEDTLIILKAPKNSTLTVEFDKINYETLIKDIAFLNNDTFEIVMKGSILNVPILVFNEKKELLDSLLISGSSYKAEGKTIWLQSFYGNEKNIEVKRNGYKDIKVKIEFMDTSTIYLVMNKNISNELKGNKKKTTKEEYIEKDNQLTSIGENESHYKEFRNEKDGSVLIYISAGEFTMGSESGESDEEPVHKVYLDGYYIMKYEVTNKQYKKFCDETGRIYPSDPGYYGMSNYFTSYPDYPVVQVNYNDAKAYVNWAGLRLPTEAEWEKAARGTDSRKYPWGSGDPGTNRCNYDYSDADGYRYTSPIGSYENGRSPYGCYDMAGNVWEWCSDWYDENYYRDSEYRNPKGPSSGDYRILRGGSWGYGAYGVRSAGRNDRAPSYCCYHGGFRCSASE